MLDEQIQVNRTNWNERTPVHAASEMYDVEGFKAGRMTLHDVEMQEVGDVSGKTLLHPAVPLRDGHYVVVKAGREGDGGGFLGCRD